MICADHLREHRPAALFHVRSGINSIFELRGILRLFCSCIVHSLLCVNGKTVYEGKKGKFVTVWNAKPYRIQNVMSVKDGDTVKIEVTFRPTQEER